MPLFTQHVPGCVDLGDEKPLSFKFDSVTELLSNEYVQRFCTNSPNFHQFSISPMDPVYSQNRFDCSLMAEYDNGLSWWCVGHIDHGTSLDLPRWNPKTV